MEPEAERTWFKDAILYEVRLRSFFDADGDGVGDFRGLTEKLDYLADLGVDTIWLLPFYPSPLKDDGYDIADYRGIHPSLGSLKDFRAFMRAAHKKNLRVVTELVLNHTSDQHPWFQRARRAPVGSRHRNYYVWSDDPGKYSSARIIFQDFETSNWTWDPIARSYFWHRFYSNQPDLNFTSPDVQKAVLDVVDFWFDLGVDGLRLDAVPYLFEREGTNCENLPETHDFLHRLRVHIDKRYKNRMLLAEANQWPEDAARYFGDGDECHMCFHFPIMPRLFMALRMEDRYPIVDILEQTPVIPDGCQWAVFLRNHDELTLEMVTDEERDYMVEAYAADRTARINLGIRRRLAPLLENNRRRIELMNGLLFSLPGTPVIYYGDEIGMGDNVYLGDRDGVRTPMQWSGDKNAGFSRASTQRLVLPPVQDAEYHFSAVNVDAQQANPSSLLWWMKRIISLRKQFRAFGRGSFETLSADNRRVLAFLRRYDDEIVLVVANLSRFAQYLQLDLREFSGIRPRELFGTVEFPEIGEWPYLIMLGPHGFYWFSLGGRRELHEPIAFDPTLTVEVSNAWDEVLKARKSARLRLALANHLPGCRWFRGKTREIGDVQILDSITLDARHALVFAEVTYKSGDPELYSVPLAFYEGYPTEHTLLRLRIKQKALEGFVAECSNDPAVAAALLSILVSGKRPRGRDISVKGVASSEFRKLRGTSLPAARGLGDEQTNTSYVYGDRFVGKLLRLVEEGQNIELEVLEHLRQTEGRGNVPRLLGHLELYFGSGRSATLCLFQEFVNNQGNAWSVTLDAVDQFYEQVLASPPDRKAQKIKSLLAALGTRPGPEIAGLIGPYLALSELLGRRTAEMHGLLANAGDNPAFKPDHFQALAKRAFYQSLRNLASRGFDYLRAAQTSFDERTGDLANELLSREGELRKRLNRVRDNQLTGLRIRVHGDYHLGQVLYTGRDFTIIDFEGEPARSRSHRRSLRSPMADVAGMLRSFHYAAQVPLQGESRTHQRSVDFEELQYWARVWQHWVSVAFVDGYLAAADGAEFVPESPETLDVLLQAYVLEKALYELIYELNHRPNWVGIPILGVLQILDSDTA